MRSEIGHGRPGKLKQIGGMTSDHVVTSRLTKEDTYAPKFYCMILVIRAVAYILKVKVHVTVCDSSSWLRELVYRMGSQCFTWYQTDAPFPP